MENSIRSKAPRRVRLAYAPCADLIWCETSHPDIEEKSATSRLWWFDAFGVRPWPTEEFGTRPP